jgi:hypothetical protein
VVILFVFGFGVVVFPVEEGEHLFWFCFHVNSLRIRVLSSVSMKKGTCVFWE